MARAIVVHPGARGVGMRATGVQIVQTLKKHKVEMDEDRKKRRLPAFVPRFRTVYYLDLEGRDTSRHDRNVAAGDVEDFEVTGLVCDSDDDDVQVNALEVESETDCFRSTGSRDILKDGVCQFNRQVGHF